MTDRKQTTKKENGFTVMELLIALAILLIVLGLGFNLYFYTQKSFQDGEQRWIQQREVKKVADYISSFVKNSYFIDIIGDIDETYSFDNEYSYIYKDSNDGIIKYKNLTESPVNLCTTDLSLNFEPAKDADDNDIYNVLDYDISANVGNYEVESSIFLQNVKLIKPLNSSDDKTDTGSAVRYMSTDSSTDDTEIDIEVGTFCFIATAAYGTPEQQSVSLLRQFRDKVLLTNPIGRSFVDFYYKHSPTLADTIKNSPVLKLATRILLLPFIGLAAIMLNHYLLIYTVFYIIMLLGLLRYRDKKYGRLG